MFDFNALTDEIKQRRALGLPDFPDLPPPPPIQWTWRKHPDLGWLAHGDSHVWDPDQLPTPGDVITITRKDGKQSQHQVTNIYNYGALSYPELEVGPETRL